MRTRQNRRARAGVTAGAGLAIVAAVAATSLNPTALAASVHSGRMPGAHKVGGAARIGALYGSAAASAHTCTASVVHSPHGDLIVTAAHCVVGNGTGMVFAPGQNGNVDPFGLWAVNAVFLEPRWRSDRDPRADVAFLTVAPRTINGELTELEQVTGAYALGASAGRSQRVTVSGYPAGVTAGPIACTNVVFLTRGYPTFDCRGFVEGTSGSPWLRVTRAGVHIVGIIGGYDRGGSYDFISYSSRFDADVESEYLSASSSRGGPAAGR